jgi:carbamate kinase
MKNKKVVIALGGNAILRKGQKAHVDSMISNVDRALTKLFPLIKENRVAITHGSGPQVGMLLLKNELAKKGGKVPTIPLDILDAEIEGQLGYLIQQSLQNIFRKKDLDRNIVTVLTQVLVDKADPGFRKPTKFVGPFYTKREADKLRKRFKIREDVGRGWRRVVPSPKPIEIIESRVIKKLLKTSIVIAAGGGGIPVVQKGVQIDGVEAVVDKDLASACLANSIKANTFIMITDVDKVYLNYKKKDQRALGKVSLREIKRYHAAGHFPSGNMGPKVQAAINFLSKKGKKVIITDIVNIDKALKGNGGTVVER